MGSAFATSAPANQVEDLMKEVAAENDLDITDQLKDLHPGQSTLEASAASTAKEDNLSRRYVCSRHVSLFLNLDTRYMLLFLYQHWYRVDNRL